MSFFFQEENFGEFLILSRPSFGSSYGFLDIPAPSCGVIAGTLEALKTVKASGDVNGDSNTSKGVLDL